MNTWTSDDPKVLLLHAYSPKNSGDGLLVELARATVLKALGSADFRVVASDAIAFEGDEYIQWGPPGIADSTRIPRRLAMLATGILGGSKSIQALVREADLVVAVGGGYLRGGSLGPAIKSWGAHFGQLRLAAGEGRKAVYLSQSIGPFSGLYKRAIAKNLAKVHTVYARDDRSVSEFSDVASIVRMPDMAVLELASAPQHPRASLALDAKPVFIARELTRPRNYYALLDEASKSDQFEWALQSTGGGNDDYPLTKRLSNQEPRTMKAVLADNTPRIVVSTRLHGALSSLIAGFPAIHLSYERKGWGAYEDLGLGDFVLNARDATLPQINALMDRIRARPDEFWSTIEVNRVKIQEMHNALIDTVRSIATHPGNTN